MARRAAGEGGGEKKRRAADTFETFCDGVLDELSKRIGGPRAAESVVNDPAFGTVLRMGFEMRASLSNAAKRTAGVLIDALATAQVAEKLKGLPFALNLDGVRPAPERRTPRATGSKTGGGEPSVESLSRSTVPVDPSASHSAFVAQTSPATGDDSRGVGDGTEDGDPI